MRITIQVATKPFDRLTAMSEVEWAQSPPWRKCQNIIWALNYLLDEFYI